MGNVLFGATLPPMVNLTRTSAAFGRSPRYDNKLLDTITPAIWPC